MYPGVIVCHGGIDRFLSPWLYASRVRTGGRFAQKTCDCLCLQSTPNLYKIYTPYIFYVSQEGLTDCCLLSNKPPPPPGYNNGTKTHTIRVVTSVCFSYLFVCEHPLPYRLLHYILPPHLDSNRQTTSNRRVRCHRRYVYDTTPGTPPKNRQQGQNRDIPSTDRARTHPPTHPPTSKKKKNANHEKNERTLAARASGREGGREGNHERKQKWQYSITTGPLEQARLIPTRSVGLVPVHDNDSLPPSRRAVSRSGVALFLSVFALCSFPLRKCPRINSYPQP